MIHNRNKKLEKQRRKREEKRLKLKSTPQSIREQHVGKDMEERMEYIKFIDGSNSIQQTNKLKENDDDLKKVVIIGDDKKVAIEKTSMSASDSAGEEASADLPSKKDKPSKWVHFKNRWNRKWADKLIDGIFGIIFLVIGAIITIIINYIFVNNTLQKKFDELKQSIEDPSSETRNNIRMDVLDSAVKKTSENTQVEINKLKGELILLNTTSTSTTTTSMPIDVIVR